MIQYSSNIDPELIEIINRFRDPLYIQQSEEYKRSTATIPFNQLFRPFTPPL